MSLQMEVILGANLKLAGDDICSDAELGLHVTNDDWITHTLGADSAELLTLDDILDIQQRLLNVLVRDLDHPGGAVRDVARGGDDEANRLARVVNMVGGKQLLRILETSIRVFLVVFYTIIARNVFVVDEIQYSV